MKHKNYDLVIVGGGTAGVAAAYTAGKLGLKTAIVEKNIHLGGSITSGLVVPAMKTVVSKINTTFFEAFTKKMKVYKGQITFSDGNEGWYNPEIAKIVLDEMMLEAAVDVYFDTILTESVVMNKKILNLNLASNMLSIYIESKYFIDATGDANLSYCSGAEFLPAEDAFQPTSLRFIMSGIDIDKFAEFLKKTDFDREVSPVASIDGEIHLSTAYTWDAGSRWALKPLVERAVADSIVTSDDMSYFQIFTVPGMPGSVAFNCPRVLEKPEGGVLESGYTSKALFEARKRMVRIAEFCKRYLEGFENAYISNIADALGVRESRRIKGKYVLTAADIEQGREFQDPALVCDYPIDIHSNKKDASTLQHISKPYMVPVESLISESIENLLVAGRCISADFKAQAAIRTQTSCFSMGEAAAKYVYKMSAL